MEYTATAATSEIQQAVMECRMQNGSLNKKQQRWPIYADATTSTKTQHARRPQQEKMSARSRELPPPHLPCLACCCKPQLATARAPSARSARSAATGHRPAASCISSLLGAQEGLLAASELRAWARALAWAARPGRFFGFSVFGFRFSVFFEHKVALGPGFRE